MANSYFSALFILMHGGDARQAFNLTTQQAKFPILFFKNLSWSSRNVSRIPYLGYHIIRTSKSSRGCRIIFPLTRPPLPGSMLGTSQWMKPQGGRYSTGCRKLRGQIPKRSPSLYGSMEVLTCLKRL